jgi:hypothetical protein
MQDISATTLAADRTAGRGAVCRVWVKWDDTNWTEETDYVFACTGSLAAISGDAGISAVGDSIGQTWDVTLFNHDNRFTEWYSQGTLYSYISGGLWQGRDVRILLGFRKSNGTADGVYVLKGNITGWQHTTGGAMVVMKCIDRSYRILKHLGKGQLIVGKRTDEVLTQMLTLIESDWRPATTFDKGLFHIPFAVVDQQSLWRQMKQAAEAEGGRLYFSPSGDENVSTKLVFENAQHLLLSPHDNYVATFAVSSWHDLLAAGREGDYYNHVTVYYTPMRIENTQEIWRSQEQYAIAPGETITVNAPFDYPAYKVETMKPTSWVEPAWSNGHGVPGYWVAGDWVATTEGGTRVTPGITVTQENFGQQSRITIANASAYQVRIRRLRLVGRPVQPMDEEYVEYPDDAEEYVYGKTGKHSAPPIRNQFIQSRAHATALAKMLHYRWSTQRLEFQIRDVIGMPWLEDGDRERVTDPIGEGGLIRDCFIQKVAFRYNAGGLWMDLSLLPVSDLFQYDGYYFVLGTSTLGEDLDSKGRYFF